MYFSQKKVESEDIKPGEAGKVSKQYQKETESYDIIKKTFVSNSGTECHIIGTSIFLGSSEM